MKKNDSHSISEEGIEKNIIDFKEIVFCKAEGNYTRIYFQEKNIITTKILKYYESILPADKFIRIHKSFIINKNFILCLKSNSRVILKPNISLPISRRRRSLLAKELSKSYLIVNPKIEATIN